MFLAFILAFGLHATPDRPGRLYRFVQAAEASQEARQPGRVSTKAVADFLLWARQKEKHDIVEVWRQAIEAFPQGWTIDGYPGSVGDPTSKYSVRALFIVSPQIEREGKKVEGMEAINRSGGCFGPPERSTSPLGLSLPDPHLRHQLLEEVDDDFDRGRWTVRHRRVEEETAAIR